MRSRIREFDSSTLNESVQNTIMRDLKAVGKKFMHVLYPRKSNTLLRDWDLWGPLILCVTLALMLQRGSVDNEKDGGPQFAEVFVIVWFGAVTITLNSKLLGGNISFFQSLCVLGYCILPLTVAMLVCRLVLLAEQGPINFMVRLFVVILMFAWSIVASTAFLADSQPPNRKALAVYPVFCFVLVWVCFFVLGFVFPSVLLYLNRAGLRKSLVLLHCIGSEFAPPSGRLENDENRCFLKRIILLALFLEHCPICI